MKLKITIPIVIAIIIVPLAVGYKVIGVHDKNAKAQGSTGQVSDVNSPPPGDFRSKHFFCCTISCANNSCTKGKQYS